MSEEVLVFPEGCMESFSEDFWKNKFSKYRVETTKFQSECLPHAFFMPREEAEKNPEVKQIIPYVVVSQDEKILTYRRTKKSGEGRLHEKYSIGIGGHINRSDIRDGVLDIWSAASRELAEEITIIKGEESQHVINEFGIMYDPSNEVGKVHFGVVYRMYLSWCGVLPNEDSMSNLTWELPFKLRAMDNLESWSQIILRNI